MTPSSSARFGAKRRWVVALLIVFTLWPLAHRALVARYRVSPWRLFGWAMYTVPRLEPKVDLFVMRDGVRAPVEYPDNDALYSPRQRRMLRAVWGYSPRQRFLTRRNDLGLLEPPDDVAAVVFRARPELEELVVVVHQPIFRARAGRFEIESSEYRYRSPAGSSR